MVQMQRNARVSREFQQLGNFQIFAKRGSGGPVLFDAAPAGSLGHFGVVPNDLVVFRMKPYRQAIGGILGENVVEYGVIDARKSFRIAFRNRKL